MAIKASIDIGTNSTRLLIAQIDNKNNISPITLIDRITRLGKGYTQEGNLTLEAMQRVINVLTDYRTIIDKSAADVSIVFATSATREAKNKAQFLNLIAEKTNFQCHIISGVEEAQLSFKGVESDMKIAGKCLVCDIGGGSTEFSFAEKGEIILCQSLNVGSRMLTTKFLKNDPVTKQELVRLEHFLEIELTNYLYSFMPEQIICVGGTATTLAMINENIPLEYPEKAHHQILKLKNLEIIINNLFVKSIQERKEITGLHPDRADVILTGALIVKSIIKHFNLTESIISLRDLLFGVLLTE